MPPHAEGIVLSFAKTLSGREINSLRTFLYRQFAMTVLHVPLLPAVVVARRSSAEGPCHCGLLEEGQCQWGRGSEKQWSPLARSPTNDDMVLILK